MPALPTGTVTFVYTDIEGSARATDQMAREYHPGIFEAGPRARHRERLEACARKYRGHEMTREGDGHLLVFQSSDEALAFAVELQSSLRGAPITAAIEGVMWTLKVRIGMHRAEQDVQPSVDAQGRVEYHDARPVNYGSRIVALAAGGQILISNETFLRSGSASHYTIVRWPNRYLKSFPRPHTVHEVLYPGGPPSTEPGMRYVPEWFVETSSYIHRPEEEAVVVGAFMRADTAVRLVTVHAEGGRGKTRLAIQCAVQMVGLFEHHAHFVRLADVEKTETAVAEAIGRAVKLPPERSSPEDVQEWLRARETLLLLDNYESVDAPEVREYLNSLLLQAMGVRLLVASRCAVGIANAEKVIPLDDGMDDVAARELFLDRTRLHNEAISLVNPEQERQLQRILDLTCRIPLALEFTAAWVGLQSLKEIADGLEARPLGDFAGLPPGTILSVESLTRERQQSLWHCIDWSWNLLDAIECRILVICSLFADSASFDAGLVKEVSDEALAPVALQKLQRLSLIQHVEVDGGTRYRLHRFTKAYASHRLAEQPDADAVRRRFLNHYAGIVPRSHNWINDDASRASLNLEWRNALAAFDLADEMREWLAMQMLANIFFYLGPRGHWSEEERVLVRALHVARAAGVRGTEALWLGNLGTLYQRQGRLEQAIGVYQDALQICRAAEDHYGAGVLLNDLGVVFNDQFRWKEALGASGEALELFRALPDHRDDATGLNKRRHGEAVALHNRGIAYGGLDRWEDSSAAYCQSLAIRRDLDDDLGVAKTLYSMSILLGRQGRWETASGCCDEARKVFSALGSRHDEGLTLNNLAALCECLGDVGRAAPYAQAAVTILEQTDDAATLALARARLVRLGIAARPEKA